MKSALLPVAVFLAVPSAAPAAPTLSAADKGWIDACANRLVADSKKAGKPARVYCACMHEMVETNEIMSQSELERSWPPVHMSCRRKAGFHRETNP